VGFRGRTNQLVDGLAMGLLNQLVRDTQGVLVALPSSPPSYGVRLGW
jgi:hypothetical protein